MEESKEEYNTSTEIKVDDFFRKHVADLPDVISDIPKVESDKEEAPKGIIDNSNNYFLIKILSPEITENENKKRKHKDTLINMIKIFLISQLCVVGILTIGIITMVFVFHGLANDIALKYINMMFKFVSVYITSVVVELIAMLNYVVKNVFDTSITQLVESYKEVTKK